MKALVYTGPRELELQERPMPEPGPGEVVLEIEAVGICGSDMHAWHGHDPRRRPGLVLGHEFAGAVAASAADGIAPGTRFTGNPLITCGRCEYCVQGRNNLCADRAMVGMTRPGAYAEYMSIPASSLVAIPPEMPARAAALTEPVATAWHAVSQASRALARPLHEARVLVIGGGAIGMAAALLLRHLGVAELAVSEPNRARREGVERHAGCRAIDPTESAPPAATFECVLDAVGAAVTRDHALASVKPGGVVVHVGLQDWSSEIDMRRLTLDEIALLGVYTYTTADLRAAVDGLHRGALGDLSWVEERPLAEGPRAFLDLDEGRSPAAKIVLRP